MHLIRLRSGVELAATERGNVDNTCALLLPGPTDSCRSYEAVLAALPDDLPVVAVSLRGHGESSKPAAGYAVEDLASDVVPLLDALGITSAVLGGHSGSCLVARRVALDAPDRVAGLFLESSPTTLRGDVRLQEFVDTVVSQLVSPIDRNLARSFVTETSTADLDPAVVEQFVDDLVKVPTQTWIEMFSSLLVYDDTSELARIVAPVSLVWGDADALVPRQMQDELVGMLPHAELTVYEGVGHTPRWEEPNRFARDLTTFARPLLG